MIKTSYLKIQDALSNNSKVKDLLYLNYDLSDIRKDSKAVLYKLQVKNKDGSLQFEIVAKKDNDNWTITVYQNLVDAVINACILWQGCLNNKNFLDEARSNLAVIKDLSPSDYYIHDYTEDDCNKHNVDVWDNNKKNPQCYWACTIDKFGQWWWLYPKK